MEQLAAAVVAALIALVSVVIGRLLERSTQREAFKRQRDWDAGQLELHKIEDIATIASEVYTAAWRSKETVHKCSPAILDQRDFRMQLADDLSEPHESGRSAIARLEMLAALYASQLSPSIADLRKSWEVDDSFLTGLRIKDPPEGFPSLSGRWIVFARQGYDKTMECCRRLQEEAGTLVRQSLVPCGRDNEP